MTPIDARRRAATTQIFVSPESLDGELADRLGDAIDDSTRHHLDRVLRVRDGEDVIVADGAGRWLATVVRRDSSGIDLVIDGSVVEATRPPSLRILTALPKGDRVEWLVQKAVEVGIDEVCFVHAARSVVRWKPERATKQMERLRRVAVEAARQSRRLWLPRIEAPVKAHDVLHGVTVAEPGGREVTESDSVIAIGPEGGWTSDELDVAGERVDLGANVLRTETAVVAAGVRFAAVTV